jgi:plastocyanin
MKARRLTTLGAAVLAAFAMVLVATAALGSSRATINVSAKDNFFDPAKVKIGAGEKVQWTNDGAVDHTVKFKGQKNKIISPGETTSKKFKKTGRYPYHCTLHSGMDGKVVVGDV